MRYPNGYVKDCDMFMDFPFSSQEQYKNICEELGDAFQKARQVRFEHGECGA